VNGTAISARGVEELRPLTDASDAQLCRRMDSVITAHPGFYFRRGNTSSPRPHRTRGSEVVGFDETRVLLFLFDNAGISCTLWAARRNSETRDRDETSRARSNHTAG